MSDSLFTPDGLQGYFENTADDVNSFDSESGVCSFVNDRLAALNVEFDCQTQEVHIFVYIVLVWIGILLF